MVCIILNHISYIKIFILILVVNWFWVGCLNFNMLSKQAIHVSGWTVAHAFIIIVFIISKHECECFYLGSLPFPIDIRLNVLTSTYYYRASNSHISLSSHIYSTSITLAPSLPMRVYASIIIVCSTQWMWMFLSWSPQPPSSSSLWLPITTMKTCMFCWKKWMQILAMRTSNPLYIQNCVCICIDTYVEEGKARL